MRHPVIAVAATLLLSAARPVSAPAAPVLFLDQSEATGPVLLSPGGPIQIVTIAMDSVRDTIPQFADLKFRWHAEPATDVAGYRYTLNGVPVDVDSSVHGVTYSANDPASITGVNLFTLRVFGNDGSTREIVRRFQRNFSPVTWVAGPDLALLDARFGWTGPPRSLPIANWNSLPDLSGTGLSCDSLTVRPVDRAPHRTFFEIYDDRLYVHAEGDTVNMNSWVVVHGGGFDPDSPYLPVIAPGSPALNDTVACAGAGTPLVTRSAGLIGSPIGLRYLWMTALDPSGPLASGAQSRLFPQFDVGSVLYFPRIAGYVPNTQSGRTYLTLRAEDAVGARDNRIDNPVAVVAAVDGGTGTPEQVAQRAAILTYYVNRAPFLLFGNPGFVPAPGHVFPGRTLELHLLADDLDPFQAGGPPGGPSSTKTLRWNLSLLGKTSDARDTTVAPLAGPVFTPDITIQVPAVLADPHVTIRVQLCDCAYCEQNPGEGRCITQDIPVTVDGVTATVASLVSSDATLERSRLEWQIDGPGPVIVERRRVDTAWEARGEMIPDGSGRARYEDREVVPGTRLGYRLALQRDAATVYAGEAWVDIPRPELALHGLVPNPSTDGRGVVHLSLAGAGEARLELIDVSGRRVARRELKALGPGRHEVALDPGARLPAGVYLLRLIEGSEARTLRAAVMR